MSSDRMPFPHLRCAPSEAASRRLSFSNGVARRIARVAGRCQPPCACVGAGSGPPIVSSSTPAGGIDFAGKAVRWRACHGVLSDSSRRWSRCAVRCGRHRLRDGGAEPAFAARWLVPRLGGFSAAYPDVELELEASDELRVIGRDTDIAIRWLCVGARRPRGRVTKLTRLDRFPVAAKWRGPRLAEKTSRQ